MMDTLSQKRVFVGGLFDGIKEADLKERFQRFGQVSSVEIKWKRNHQGVVDKTFAYLDINISDGNYKKCLATYNNTKWKGGIVTIQPAKENFIARLNGEREAIKKEKETERVTVKSKSEEPAKQHPRVEKRHDHFQAAGVRDYHAEKAVPGTAINGEKNWVVGKYGRVLPIVYIRRPDKKKIMKVDPSKYVHHLKVMKEASKKEADFDEQHHQVSDLTWDMAEEESSKHRKRIGEFEARKQPTKKSRLQNGSHSHSIGNEDLPVDRKQEMTGRNDTRKSDETPPKVRVQDDFEVVRTEENRRKSIDHSSYLRNLNRRTKTSTGVASDNILSKFASDSDNESVSSADTDEIIGSAKKTDVTSRRTTGSSETMDEHLSYGKQKNRKSDDFGISSKIDGLNEQNDRMNDNESSDVESQSADDQSQSSDSESQSSDSESNSSDSESSDENDTVETHQLKKPNLSVNDKSTLSPVQNSGQLSELDHEQHMNKTAAKQASSAALGPPKFAKDSLASFKVETQEESSEEEDSSSDNEDSTSDSDDEDTPVSLDDSDSKGGVQQQIAKGESSEEEESSSESDDEDTPVSLNDSDSKGGVKQQIAKGESSGEEESSSESDDGDSPTSHDNSISKHRVPPQISKESLESFLREESSSSSEEEESAPEDGHNQDIPISTQVTSSKPVIAPTITKEGLTSFLGETSSSSSSSEEESSSLSEDDNKQDIPISPLIISSKPIAAPKITKEGLASFLGETSSSEESSEESSSEDDDDSDSEVKLESNKAGKNISKVPISPESVKQNCQVINSILLENLDESQAKHSSNVATSNSSENGKIKRETKQDKTQVSSLNAASRSNSDKTLAKKSQQVNSASVEAKKTMSNEARLESMKRKQNEMSKQKALIHGALKSVDSKDASTPGKHFHFDSDSDEEEKPEMEEESQEKSKPVKKKGFQLFDSDDEDNDGHKVTDDVYQFEKPQYEGKTGAKLMKLQSRFGGDDRFKMDTRFLDKEESDSKSADGDEEDKEKLDPDEEDLKEERKRSLAILEKIVGTRAMTKSKPVKDSRNAFKDLSALRYDPTKEEHSKFEQTEVEPESPDRDGDVVTKMQREEQPAPEVSKEKFYEVTTSLKDVFSGAKSAPAGGQSDEAAEKPFTFFTQDDEESEEDKPTVDDTSNQTASSLNTFDLMWKPKKFAYDSSDSEQDEDEDEEEKSKEKEESMDTSKTQSGDTADGNELTEQMPSRKFFFQEDDMRLKEGPKWFFNVSKAAHRQEKMKEKNEELKAGFRKRHCRAVRTWNRKKMDKQQRKYNR